MMRYCIVFIVVFFSLRAEGQFEKAKFFFNANVFQEMDLMNSWAPVGGSFMLGAGKIMLSGDYRFNRFRFNRYQLLEETTTYSGYLSLVNGKKDDEEGFVFTGLRMGYTAGDQYKRVMIDEMSQPVDASGKLYDIDFGVIPVRSGMAAIGLTYVKIMRSKSKYMEMMADQYDLDKIGEKKRKSQIVMNFELLFAPSFDYSRSFYYAPWGYYVPQRLTLTQEMKEKKFGVRIRVEHTTFSGMGYLMEMGAIPGIKASSETSNDFRLTLKTGLIYNFSYAH